MKKASINFFIFYRCIVISFWLSALPRCILWRACAYCQFLQISFSPSRFSSISSRLILSHLFPSLSFVLFTLISYLLFPLPFAGNFFHLVPLSPSFFPFSCSQYWFVISHWLAILVVKWNNLWALKAIICDSLWPSREQKTLGSFFTFYCYHFRFHFTRHFVYAVIVLSAIVGL